MAKKNRFHPSSTPLTLPPLLLECLKNLWDKKEILNNTLPVDVDNDKSVLSDKRQEEEKDWIWKKEKKEGIRRKEKRGEERYRGKMKKREKEGRSEWQID